MSFTPFAGFVSKGHSISSGSGEFIRNALNYAHDELGLGQIDQQVTAAIEADGDILMTLILQGSSFDEAIRQYSILQFGLWLKQCSITGP